VFFDYRILRGDLQGAESFSITAGGRTVNLEHTPRTANDPGGWFVSGKTKAGTEVVRLPAATDIVEEFLLAFRQSELGDLRPDVELPAQLVAQRLTVEMYGLKMGGDFALDPSPREDSKGYLFRRFEDGICVEVDSARKDALLTGAEHFLDRRVHEIAELELDSIELLRGEQHLVFVRDTNTGFWNREGSAEEDRPFALIVDRLRSMKALTWSLDERLELVAPIEVRLNILEVTGPRGHAASTVSFTVGDGGKGTDPCDLVFAEGASDRGRANLFPGLWSALDGLF
jgi:hypothetical protein